MSSIRLALAVSLIAPAFGASAQNAPMALTRATIESVSPDGASLAVKTRGGDAKTIRLDNKSTVILVVPASLADVKTGAFIGVAALPGEGGALKAMEVHVFPEAMRGTGEGFHPSDLAPGSTMTNGNVQAKVDGVEGPKLTVTYKGGQQTIVVDSKTPIVGFAPGARTDLKPGAAIVERDATDPDRASAAAFILVGKDGLVPPL